MCIIGIRVSKNKSEPNYAILQQMANECFMPLSYGGGIDSFEKGKKILTMGFEKLLVNTVNFQSLNLIKSLSDHFGAQSVIAGIDYDFNWRGKPTVYGRSATEKMKFHPIEWAQKVQEAGAGEILLTSIQQEGTWEGFDTDMLGKVVDAVDVPVIAHGGAGSLKDLEAAKNAGASAIGLGSMVVYQKKGMGVLVNFPDRKKIRAIL